MHKTFSLCFFFPPLFFSSKILFLHATQSPSQEMLSYAMLCYAMLNVFIIVIIVIIVLLC